jgi:hypothetical protein
MSSKRMDEVESIDNKKHVHFLQWMKFDDGTTWRNMSFILDIERMRVSGKRLEATAKANCKARLLDGVYTQVVSD